MIKYNLKCKNKHEFESWFSDSKEFEKLLNSQLSKNTIEEGKIIEGKINKITEKFVFLFVLAFRALFLLKTYIFRPEACTTYPQRICQN